MTILFSNPPWWAQEPVPGQPNRMGLRRGIRAGSRWPFTNWSHFQPDHFVGGGYTPAPQFLSSAAAYVERAVDGEHTVLIRDSIARGESYETFFAYIEQTKPDHFIIEVGAASWEHDRLLIVELKRRYPHLKVAVAGPVTQDEAKRDPGGVVDAWLLGEYEKNSVAFVEGARGVIPFNLLTREEMNRLPVPMYDEGCALNYWDACPVGTTAPELQIWGSRGCFAVCNFCSFPATMTNNDPLGLGGRKIRFYDTAWLEMVIRARMAVAASNGTPLASVRFDGDTENASNKHTLAICEMMKRIGLPWSMMCRADTSSREVWQAMKDSGCFGVKIGFESGVDRIVNQIVKKNLNIAEAAQTAIWLRSIGLSVHGTFMIGHPTETPAERQQTIDFIQKLYDDNGLNSHQLSGTAEISGTPLANQKHNDPDYVRNPDGVSKLQGMQS